jgi:hypothetical protein
MKHRKYGFVEMRSQFLQQRHFMYSFLHIIQNVFSLMMAYQEGLNMLLRYTVVYLVVSTVSE